MENRLIVNIENQKNMHMMSKTFKGDFDIFLNYINRGTNFSLTRFGDGEMMIINGTKLDLLKKGAGEFAYIPNNVRCESSRKLLTESFTYKDPTYFVGIACRCCVGDDKHNSMKKSSNQLESNLTWANIFVNSNFNIFNTHMLTSLKNRKLALICHKASNTDDLPFNVDSKYIFKVNADAWIHDIELIDKIKRLIDSDNMKDYVFLISAGPFANILVCELHKHDKNNTYLDVGSVLDKYLKLPLTRGYLKGSPTLKKICVW